MTPAAEKCEHGHTRYRSNRDAIASVDALAEVESTGCCGAWSTFDCTGVLVCRCCRNTVVTLGDPLVGIVKYPAGRKIP